MIFFVFFVLAIGTLIFGWRFLGDAWRLVRHGAPQALDEVAANRLFQLLFWTIVAAIVLPLGGGLLAIFIAHSHHWGPGVARALIFVSFLTSFFLLGTIWGLADIFGRVLGFFDPTKNVELVRAGLRDFSLTGLAVELFAAAVLFTIGVYASVAATAAGLIGALLIWIVGEAWNMPSKLLRPMAMTMGGLLITWYIAAAIPPSLWLGLTGRDLSPIFRLHSAVDNIDADEAEERRLERERELCSEEIQRLENLLGAAGAPARGRNFSARLEDVRRYSRELEAVKRACSERTRIMDLR